MRDRVSAFQQPARARAAATLKLERTLSDLVNQAYALTPAEIDLMWQGGRRGPDAVLAVPEVVKVGLVREHRGVATAVLAIQADRVKEEGAVGIQMIPERLANLRVTGFGKTGRDIWLSFNNVSGRTSRVESTDGEWQE